MVRRLLILNGISAIMVAFHHAAAYGFNFMFNWGDQAAGPDPIGSFAFYVTLSIRQLDSFAIPAFLFVSGFFVAFSARGEGNLKWNAVWQRVKVLLWPWIIWLVIVTGLQMRLPRSVNDALGTYYYIPLVIQLFVLSPFLVPQVKRNWKAVLWITAALQLFVMSLRYMQLIGVTYPGQAFLISVTPQWFFPGRIFYFAIGLVAGLHLTEFKTWMVENRRALLTATVITALLTVPEYLLASFLAGKEWVGPTFVGLTRTVYAVLFILTFLAYDDFYPPLSKQLQEVGGQSLGVYLMNTPVIYVVSSLIFQLVPILIRYQGIYQGILILTGLFIPLAVMWAVKKSPFRGRYRYLFG